jgi:hypothetical protein
MLVRKGAASPSLESLPPAPPRPRPVVVSTEPAARGPLPDDRERSAPPKPPAAPAPTQPPQPTPRKSEVAAGNPPAAPFDASLRAPQRASARLTHDQMRALKLASLLLDRPQQELLASGLDLKLESLSCTSLAECACFKNLVEQLSSGR